MASRYPKSPPLGCVRLAKVEDAPFILELLNESISKNFRVECAHDIIYLIENCVLSVCQMDTKGNIVGFLAVRDYPMVPSMHPLAWEEFVWVKYKALEMNARNTLFIHLLCWHQMFGREAIDSMLQSIFMNDPYLLYIAMLKSLNEYPLLVPGQARSEASFRRVVVAPERGVNNEALPALCVADRTEISPRLRIRRAVEEDNDDLVPILEQHSDQLRLLYGDFYISELISRHPESERVLLVCEHRELAVGVMCLNTQINYESLEDNFVLSPFGGLRHLQTAPNPKHTPKENDSTCSLIVEPHDTDSVKQHTDTLKTRVKWVFEDNENKTFHNAGSTPATPPKPTVPVDAELPLNQLQILELFDDEEEEFEFDIVNIDTDLLRVPEMLSYETLRSPAEVLMNIITGMKESTVDDKRKEKSKKSTPGSSGGFKLQDTVRYTGTPNAFLLELFAMQADYDERHGFDMLEAAYELFPNRDYCVMCLPSNHPSFPLLEHFTLVTPISVKMRFINSSLYVAHVNSVRGKLSVRPGEPCDAAALKNVLEHSPRIDTLLGLFQSTLTSDNLESYILLSEEQPMGIAILGPLEDSTAVRTHYDLEPEPRRPGNDGAILAGVMSPAFEPHARWYMRELLRRSRYATLFWICGLFAKGETSPSRNLMSLAGHMVPVHPRQSVPNISGSKDLDKIYKDLACPFALWVLDRPLTSLPKVYVNSSIIVVGASRTGLAFLETLLMGPTCQYLTFSNVTLVSEHGLPTVADCLKAADICVPRDGRYTDRYIKSVPFYYYVDIMSAVMIKIDRKRNCIHLKGGGTKFYDKLVLTCGRQFQHPDYLKESLGLVKEVAKGKPCDRLLMDNPKYKADTVPMPPEMPENVFLINSLFEANLCLRKLMRMISDTKENGEPLSKNHQVVVYGDCIEAYSCIAALLELGLLPELIVFVEPFPSNEEPTTYRVNCFNDETVDTRVQNSIETIGIRVLRQCYLAAWQQIGNRVESLDFMSPLTAISLKCFALFYYGLRAFDLHAFKAINESGLVYDGGLVVGPTFETNDPNIYGAGTCVRYSRRLYATRSMHQNHCSEDIGEALGKLFLHCMDPFMMGDPNVFDTPTDLLPRYSSSSLGFRGSISKLSATGMTGTAYRRWQPVMKFESPIVDAATLPGPLYYMKLRNPGPEVPMAVQQCLPSQGHTLVTDKDENYFRLKLNVFHVIDGVTCLSHKPFSPEILSQLYGKHEAFFNKLYYRYEKGQIIDFYEFFTQPWMSALYQETFRDLVDDINQQDVGTVGDLLKSKFTVFDEELNKLKSKLIEADSSVSSLSISSSASYNIEEPRRCGTFRSVLEKYMIKTSSNIFERASANKTIVPLECGQSLEVRAKAETFWEKMHGQRIMLAHLSRYLDTHSVTNPHFAIPKPQQSL